MAANNERRSIKEMLFTRRVLGVYLVLVGLGLSLTAAARHCSAQTATEMIVQTEVRISPKEQMTVTHPAPPPVPAPDVSVQPLIQDRPLMWLDTKRIQSSPPLNNGESRRDTTA